MEQKDVLVTEQPYTEDVIRSGSPESYQNAANIIKAHIIAAGGNYEVQCEYFHIMSILIKHELTHDDYRDYFTGVDLTELLRDVLTPCIMSRARSFASVEELYSYYTITQVRDDAVKEILEDVIKKISS